MFWNTRTPEELDAIRPKWAATGGVYVAILLVVDGTNEPNF